MKIILASMLFALATGAPVVRKLNQEQQQDDAVQEEEEFAWLQNYEQVFLKCLPGEKTQNAEGNWEYNSVLYRLCPSESSCDDKGNVCSSGYGDFKVGLETYMMNFMEQFQRQQEQNGNNNQQDDQGFNFAEFGECREFNYDAQDDGNGNQVQYFVGPACTEDGDVRIALYTDEYCRPDYESFDVTFEDLTGFELPYSDGGLMDDDECKAYYCFGQNDNGEYELNEFCMDIYENTQVKCEEKMETFSYYGQDVSGCEYISALMPEEKSSGAWWFLFALLIAAIAGFGIWYFLNQKKKQSSVNSDGLMM